MRKEMNPFPVTGYAGPEYFCDRETELGVLKKHIRNRNNVTLFAIRRLGKTGLVYHLLHSLQKDRKTAVIYLDILGTTNLTDFCNQLATAIYRRFPENKPVGKRIFDFIRLLRPVISYDELSGQPELSIDARQPGSTSRSIQQLFGFLDKQGFRIVFAIDEFQQVLQYPEKNTEALLRTSMQSLKNTSFIFCGSDQRMMHEIFSDARRPFFASCINLHLGHIPKAGYESFIRKMFRRAGRDIDPDSTSFIYDWTLGHTYYTQYFCNQLFISNGARIRIEDVHATALGILRENENAFYQYRNLLTPFQWQLLYAIGKETRLYRAHASDFIRRYGLGTSSRVTRGLDSLLAKQMIFYHTIGSKPYYEVYDKFLMRWMQHAGR